MYFDSVFVVSLLGYLCLYQSNFMYLSSVFIAPLPD
jgi:hypothetical protein